MSFFSRFLDASTLFGLILFSVSSVPSSACVVTAPINYTVTQGDVAEPFALWVPSSAGSTSSGGCKFMIFHEPSQIVGGESLAIIDLTTGKIDFDQMILEDYIGTSTDNKIMITQDPHGDFGPGIYAAARSTSNGALLWTHPLVSGQLGFHILPIDDKVWIHYTDPKNQSDSAPLLYDVLDIVTGKQIGSGHIPNPDPTGEPALAQIIHLFDQQSGEFTGYFIVTYFAYPPSHSYLFKLDSNTASITLVRNVTNEPYTPDLTSDRVYNPVITKFTPPLDWTDAYTVGYDLINGHVLWNKSYTDDPFLLSSNTGVRPFLSPRLADQVFVVNIIDPESAQSPESYQFAIYDRSTGKQLSSSPVMTYNSECYDTVSIVTFLDDIDSEFVAVQTGKNFSVFDVNDLQNPLRSVHTGLCGLYSSPSVIGKDGAYFYNEAGTYNYIVVPGNSSVQINEAGIKGAAEQFPHSASRSHRGAASQKQLFRE